MALEELLSALTREAQAEADRLLAEAQHEAAERAATVDALIAARRTESLGSRARLQEAELQGALAAARLEGRQQELHARERLLERLFARLLAQCPAATTHDDYLAMLPQRITAAMGSIDPASAVVIRAPAALISHLRRAGLFPERVSLIEDESVGTGFTLVSGDGTLEIVDTLERLLMARRTMLARMALSQLGPVA